MNIHSPIQDIGRRSPRFDAPDKTTGKEVFASDVYPENMLWAGVLRANIPHGEILARAANLARLAETPITDVRASADYRRQVAGNIVLRLAAL